MSDKHTNFIQYMEYIVNHDNYKSQPCRFNKDGKITWVKTAKSCPERVEWWDSQVVENDLNNRAELARFLHPKELNGLKPCSECGKKLSIYYVYPGKNFLNRINSNFKTNYKIYNEDIYKIINDLSKKNNEKDILDFFINTFKIAVKINSIKDLTSYLFKYHTHDSQKGKMLSPGVMSNPPDRFDGFHTYNACCRKDKDKGRHDENMKNYTRDRRAFEHWADGNFTLSNQVMAEFKKYDKLVICSGCQKRKKVSPDHIGPISLGFCHREKFDPLCSSCNSAKNNRMTLKNVEMLLSDEKRGEQVVSWHSKFLWDKLKNKIETESMAKKASSIMRENMHYILASLNIIHHYQNGDEYLLSLLHPEYVKYKYKITNFNPLALDKMKIEKTVSIASTKTKSKKRYIEISFEELKKYNEKENRNYNEKLLKKYNADFLEIKQLLSEKKYSEANKKLISFFQLLASELEHKFINS